MTALNAQPSTLNKPMTKPTHHIFVCGSFRATGAQGVCHKKESAHLLQYFEQEAGDRGLAGFFGASGFLRNLAGRPRGLDFIDPSAFFVLFGVAGVEDYAISRLQRRLQSNGDPFVIHAGYLAKVHAAFLAEAAMNKLLIVGAAKPACVKTA